MAPLTRSKQSLGNKDNSSSGENASPSERPVHRLKWQQNEGNSDGGLLITEKQIVQVELAAPSEENEASPSHVIIPEMPPASRGRKRKGTAVATRAAAAGTAGAEARVTRLRIQQQQGENPVGRTAFEDADGGAHVPSVSRAVGTDTGRAGVAAAEADAAEEARPVAAEGIAAGEIARRRFLDIARRRAAHFAHFAGDEVQDDQQAVAASGAAAGQVAAEAAREAWPGPFSTARQLVEGRAAAAAAREGQLAGASRSSTQPAVLWVPSRVMGKQSGVNGLHGVAAGGVGGSKAVPSLFDLTAILVCENIEFVESLVGLPDAIRRRLSARLSSRRKIVPKTLALLVEGEPSEICAMDCTLVNEQELTAGLVQCAPDRLELLELGMCGRGLSDQALTSTIAAKPGSLPKLTRLSLGGAYRITDKALAAVATSAHHLASVELTYCSLLTASGILTLATSLGPHLESLSLHGCSQLDAMELLPALRLLPHLRQLDLSEVGGVSDDFATELCVALGSGLRDLRLAKCFKLTDQAAAAIGACCPCLEMLDLNGGWSLTDLALARIADGCRRLRGLFLKWGKFSDEALAALVTASGSAFRQLSVNCVRQAGDQFLVALATHSPSLELLDASFCRQMSDQGLGLLADSCASLRHLRLFGCSQVTDTFLQGHSNFKLEVVGRGDDIRVDSFDRVTGELKKNVVTNNSFC